MLHARCPDTCTTPPLHVAYTQQGDEAGDNGPEMAVGARIPVQAEREERADQAGYGNAQIQNGDFRQRLFQMKLNIHTEITSCGWYNGTLREFIEQT